jgi:hypothetical protein
MFMGFVISALWYECDSQEKSACEAEKCRYRIEEKEEKSKSKAVPSFHSSKHPPKYLHGSKRRMQMQKRPPP